MHFDKLEKINVTMHIEKKGRFSYLSWPYAVSSFRKNCPDGYWVVNRCGDVPYLSTEFGVFVSVTVFTDNECHGFEQVHPVLDNANKPVPTPTPFQINTSIQRCLVKAIAIATGIGLHIYAGEDLPPDSEQAPPPPKPKPTPKAKPKPPVTSTWTPAQNKKLQEAGAALELTPIDREVFKGWLARRFDVETWDDIPSTGKSGMVVNKFAELYDEWKTGGL